MCRAACACEALDTHWRIGSGNVPRDRFRNLLLFLCLVFYCCFGVFFFQRGRYCAGLWVFLPESLFR